MWLLIFLVCLLICAGSTYWYLFGKPSPFSLNSVRPPAPREFDQKKRDKVIKQGKMTAGEKSCMQHQNKVVPGQSEFLDNQPSLEREGNINNFLFLLYHFKILWPNFKKKVSESFIQEERIQIFLQKVHLKGVIIILCSSFYKMIFNK